MDTLPEPRKTGWPKGVSGNPAGRKPGSKNRLAEALLSDLADFYAERSQELLQRCFEESPIGFLQCLIKLLPKEMIASLTVNSTSVSVQMDAHQRQKIAESWILSAESAKEKAIPGVMEIDTKRVAAQEKSRKPK